MLFGQLGGFDCGIPILMVFRDFCFVISPVVMLQVRVYSCPGVLISRDSFVITRAVLVLPGDVSLV